MTELIDRYLAAVGRELPERERADIVAELRDALMSEVEGREDGLGRQLTPQELEATLVAFGHPLLVAGRYRKTPYLIGPTVFPFWWAAVKATLVVIAAIYVVLIVLAAISGGHIRGVDVPHPSVVVGFAFGAITLVCGLVERFGRPEILARWRPARLPPPQGKRASRFDLMTELGMGVVFLLWWIGVINIPSGLPAIGLAPVWADWFWWILGYSLIEIGTNVVALVRPDRVTAIRWAMIWRSLMGAGILIAVLQADPLLIVSEATSVAPRILENWMRGAIGVIVTIFLARAVTEAWRLRQDSYAEPAAT